MLIASHWNKIDSHVHQQSTLYTVLKKTIGFAILKIDNFFLSIVMNKLISYTLFCFIKIVNGSSIIDVLVQLFL